MANANQPQRDVAFRLIMGLVIAVTLWILATPFVSSVAMTSMRRFHLGTKSFGLWAIQQIVPSMYNFGNTVQIYNIPPGMIDPVLQPERPRYLNHFPTRRLTFADGRYHLLSRGDHKWMDVTSTYRGLELKTRIHANPLGDGRYEMIRMDAPASEELSP